MSIKEEQQHSASFHFGVDVGTSSVRVGLFDLHGRLVDHMIKEIAVHNPRTDYYEQSSDEIWSAICDCFKQILLKQSAPSQQTRFDFDSIRSIGFDATCSLVVLDHQYEPVSVSTDENQKKDRITNVIMWMDHRAKKQAEFINQTKHECLKSVGGSISLEMDPPKILWLKENMRDECYSRVAHFLSLPDFLVWKCTQVDLRSICCVTCKWLFTYDDASTATAKAARKCWDPTFWQRINLGDLIDEGNDFSKIGKRVEKPFEFIDELKLTDKAASELGILKRNSSKIKVGVAMIDAHACTIGALAVASTFLQSSSMVSSFKTAVNLDEILVIVSGTSACIMANTKEPKFISGIWGPYYEAVLPGMWLNEAGQSVCGQLIQRLISYHPAYLELEEKLKQQQQNSFYSNKRATIFDLIHDHLKSMAKTDDDSAISIVAKDFHIYPDFHGNRSPLADPNLRGSVCGLTLDNSSLDNLAITYLAALQALAYQTKHIVDIMKSHGMSFKLIKIIGGLASNNFYCQLISDVVDLPVLVADNKSSFDSIGLLGASILGASNTNEFRGKSLEFLFNSFGRRANENDDLVFLQSSKSMRKFHEQKFKVYLRMLDDQTAYKNLMNQI